MTITRSDISSILAIKANLSSARAKSFVDLFFDEIVDSLERGEDVKFINFGRFTLMEKRERPGRNPRTGEYVPIKARRVVTFHPSRRLKYLLETGGRFR